MEERVLLQSNCSLYRVTTKEELDTFSCGDKDLDDFFHREACLYDGQLLGKTYFFATERSGKDEIVCAFTLANDSIKAALIPNASRNRIQRKIPNSKRTRSYPAVLIGRLGVAKDFQSTHDGIGSQAIDYIISWFLLPDNKTGCRFIVVDAYNKENVLHFYEKNGFKFLYSTEDLEKDVVRQSIKHLPRFLSRISRRAADRWLICLKENQPKHGKNEREKHVFLERLQPQNFWCR